MRLVNKTGVSPFLGCPTKYDLNVTSSERFLLAGEERRAKVE